MKDDLMEIGDIVRLKSGGPKMTIVSIDESAGASCTWFDRNGKRHESVFALATVEAFVARPQPAKKSDW